MCLKEEHGAMVARIQQDNEHKESTLQAYHKEELQRIQSQAENELREVSCKFVKMLLSWKFSILMKSI